MWTMAACKEYFNVKEETNHARKVKNLIISGALSGMFSWLIVMPFDIIKSLVQTHPTKLKIIDAYKQIKYDYGWRGFYYGLTPTIVRGGQKERGRSFHGSKQRHKGMASHHVRL